jgi:hypothetical protein
MKNTRAKKNEIHSEIWTEKKRMKGKDFIYKTRELVEVVVVAEANMCSSIVFGHPGGVGLGYHISKGEGVACRSQCHMSLRRDNEWSKLADRTVQLGGSNSTC